MQKFHFHIYVLTVSLLLIHSVSLSSGDDSESFNSAYIAQDGLCCEMCPKGHHWTKDCNSEGLTACDLLTLPPAACLPACKELISQNVGCDECPEGTYMDTWNHAAECKKHTTACPDERMVNVSQGNDTSDIVCECPVQYTGYFDRTKDPPLKHCELWKMCPTGEEPEEEPTVHSNTVCRACPIGTYSNQESLEPCQPCEDGTHASEEGSVTCIHHSGCQQNEHLSEAGNAFHDDICEEIEPQVATIEDMTTVANGTANATAATGSVGEGTASEVPTILLGLILGIGIPLLFFLILFIVCKQCKKRSQRTGKNDEEAEPMAGKKPGKNSEPNSKSKGDSDAKPTVHDLLDEYEDDDTLSDKYKDLPFIDEDIASQASQRSRRQINPRI